jgi:hypothetical protein
VASILIKSQASFIGLGNSRKMKTLTLLAVIIEGIKHTFLEAYNAVLLMKGIGINQAISFLTTNCMKLQSRGDRINPERAKSKEATGKKKCNHCGQIGHTTKWGLLKKRKFYFH